MEVVRRIRGNLNGSIDISQLEDLIIAHPSFQRLRRIKQTAFLSYVFPGATHSRFEHSLGVMHLAKKAWIRLEENQRRLRDSCARYNQFAEREKQSPEQLIHGLLAPTFDVIDEIFSSSYALQCIRLAALLHDLGHPPFSHSGEKFLPPLKDLVLSLQDTPAYLREYVSEQAQLDPRGLASHEVFSFLLIEKVLSEVYKANPQLNLKVEARDVISILCTDIAPASSSPLAKNKLHLLLHELVSGEIDIDRMDYLQRDSKECGVVYGIFDEERLMDSLCFCYDPHDETFHLGILYSGLAAFEDYLRARQSMYVQLYFHKTAVACEAMLKRIRSMVNKALPMDLDQYIKIDEGNFQNYLTLDMEKKLSKEEWAKLSKVVNNLFYDRVLWKRAYESTHRESDMLDLKDLERAEALLNELHLPYEKVSSQNLLSKIKTRKHGERSRNNLRVIKKDSKQFLRVVPIEDLCAFAGHSTVVKIHRLYVDEIDQVRQAKLQNLLLNSF